MDLPERKIFKVSELTNEIRELLERGFSSVWVQGEVSNFHAAPSGHMYFTLKDDSAQIRCVMFKIQSRFLKFRMEDGLAVIAWGRLSVYSLRGEYQLILDTMEPMGLGSLMLAFEQIKAKLAAEGLFDERTKRRLPAYPKTVGLVTSPRGAAVKDMIRVLKRRCPGVHIVVSPTSVQGDRAPDEIVAALDRLCSSGEPDVIIIGRGGGSVEDLWAFNDERVVRATARCPIPIIAAVGHETDVTLTDFAADLRASTPSVAAEMAVPDRRELSESLGHLLARLRNAMTFRLGKCTEAVTETLKRLYDPRRRIEERRMRMDELTMRLGNAMARRAALARRDAEALTERLRPGYVTRTILEGKARCDELTLRMERSMRNALQAARHAAENLTVQLDGLSPLSVLERGYSITMRQDNGKVVTDASTAGAGDDVRIRLHRGELFCRVTGKDEE
ncbi:MAG: exodeoxyribonuclease VII large subunit [Pseudomonadota bacterium]